MAEIEELETDILKLRKEFQQSGSKEVYQLLVNKKLKYNKLHTLKNRGKKTKQKHF